MRALRTYPIRLQKIQDDTEMIIVDLLIDGRLKHIEVDTGAHDALVLFEPAAKPGRTVTKPGLKIDFSGTAINVKMQLGSIVTSQEALYLNKQVSNNEYIAAHRQLGISGFIGFHCLLPYFNTISYQDKQLQFIPEAELTKQRIFSVERLLPQAPKFKTSFAFLSDEEEVFIVDTGSPVALEMVPSNMAMSAQEVIVKLPASPLQFTFSGGKYPVQKLDKSLPLRVLLLGMDFMKRVGSLSFTRDKIYLHSIRYQGKNLACQFTELEVYKDTFLIFQDLRVPIKAGSKASKVSGPALPALVVENPG